MNGSAKPSLRKSWAPRKAWRSESNVAFRALHVVHDHPYAAIIEAAQTNHCDLICMASHGRKGLSALILGSETTKVLTHSKIPVLVCR